MVVITAGSPQQPIGRRVEPAEITAKFAYLCGLGGVAATGPIAGGLST